MQNDCQGLIVHARPVAEPEVDLTTLPLDLPPEDDQGAGGESELEDGGAGVEDGPEVGTEGIANSSGQMVGGSAANALVVDADATTTVAPSRAQTDVVAATCIDCIITVVATATGNDVSEITAQMCLEHYSNQPMPQRTHVIGCSCATTKRKHRTRGPQLCHTRQYCPHALPSHESLAYKKLRKSIRVAI